MYYDISVKSHKNVEKPFLSIIRKLSGIHDVKFITLPTNECPSTDKEMVNVYKQYIKSKYLSLPDQHEL